MVMYPGMYNHTRVCIITHTTTTISRRHQCDSHDSHVNVRHHTGGVVIAKTEGPNSARSRPRRPSPRETRRTFVTGVRVREVRGSRHPRSVSTAREKKRRARSPPSTGRTRARRMHAVIGEIVASREDVWSERRALRGRLEAIGRRFESTNANAKAKARGRRHERARGGRIFVSRRHSSSRGRGDEQSRP